MLALGFQAVPGQRRMFTSQIKQVMTPTEIQKLEKAVLDPLYNADGTMKFMVDYDGVDYGALS